MVETIRNKITPKLEAETSYEEALKDLDKERHGTVKDLLAAKLSDGIKIVINEMVDLKMHELFKAQNKELQTSENKRKRAEADTDEQRLKRRRDNLETLVGYVEDEKTLDNARVQKVIDKLVEIETEFLKDGYKEEELKKGYEDMYSANTIGEKIGEVNERLKEVQTKYAKLS